MAHPILNVHVCIHQTEAAFCTYKHMKQNIKMMKGAASDYLYLKQWEDPLTESCILIPGGEWRFVK